MSTVFSKSTAQELRVGVVGVGQRAVLAEYANRPGYSRVVSCADTTERGRDDARRLFGPDVAVHEDYREMTGDDLDAVFVLTPDFVHTEPVVHLLEAGIAVFVEKPMAISIEDCDAMLAAARSLGARLYVGHNLRHLPTLRAMRRLIDEGAVGRVRAVWCRHFVGSGGDYYFKDWHAERAKTTSLLLQKGAHDIDVIHWLAGGYSREVVGLGALTVYGENPHRRGPDPAFDRQRMPEWFDRDAWPPARLRDLNPTIDVEDLSMMTAKLDNDVYMSYQQCHYTPDYWRNYTVIGDAGRLENFGDGIEGDPAVVRVWNARRSGYRAEADVTVEITPDTAERHGGADQQLVAEFLRFAVEGGATETSPLAAREAVAAGVAATESLRHGGRPVTVPALDPALRAYFEAHQSAPHTDAQV